MMQVLSRFYSVIRIDSHKSNDLEVAINKAKEIKAKGDMSTIGNTEQKKKVHFIQKPIDPKLTGLKRKDYYKSLNR